MPDTAGCCRLYSTYRPLLPWKSIGQFAADESRTDNKNETSRRTSQATAEHGKEKAPWIHYGDQCRHVKGHELVNLGCSWAPSRQENPDVMAVSHGFLNEFLNKYQLELVGLGEYAGKPLAALRALLGSY